MAWAPESTSPRAGGRRRVPGAVVGREVGRWASLSTLEVLRRLDATPRGLTEEEAEARLARTGGAALPVGGRRGPAARLPAALSDPFTVLLGVAGLLTLLTGYPATAAVEGVLVAVSCVLRYREEARCDRGGALLRSLVAGTATVLRRADGGSEPLAREVPVDELVPGDVVQLAAGDLVPADLRLLRAEGLMISQAALTGEGGPVPKAAPGAAEAPARGPVAAGGQFDQPQLCFLGSSVAAGGGTGVVVATGAATRFGSAYRSSRGRRRRTAYRRSVLQVVRALAAGVLALLPVALLVGRLRGHGLEAVPLTVAVAVGLVPETLPVVATTVLARGAVVAARRRVVVRQLPAVHDLGALDVLCLDKTGTLTEERTVVEGWFDPVGRPVPAVLHWAALGSRVLGELGPPGAFDAADEALLDAAEQQRAADGDGDGLEAWEGVEVFPFDHARRRSTAVVRDPRRPGRHLLVTKGAPEAVLERCAVLRSASGEVPLDGAARARIGRLTADHAARGVRLLAVAVADRPVRPLRRPYRESDDVALTLLGFVTLRDRVQDSAAPAVSALAAQGVRLKVLTGDHPQSAARICRELGLEPGTVLLGREIAPLDDRELARVAERTVAFARVSPGQKARIVRALGRAGHTVGFLGDGLNDTAALRAADVGICTDRAVGAAHAAANVVLTGPDLVNAARAVRVGRQAVARLAAYLRIVLSSNLGNALSILVGGVLLPYLPMLPDQALLQNLCFDAAQLSLAFDRSEPPAGPYGLRPGAVIGFALRFGLLNTLADLATFLVLDHLVGPGVGAGSQAVFHTGWFTENLLTQAAALFLLRGPRPGRRWWQGPVLPAAAALAAVGLLLPLSPVAGALGMRALPFTVYPAFAAVLAVYAGTVRIMLRREVRGRGRAPGRAAG